MAFTVRVLFSGITAFVPDVPFGSSTPPRVMTVLFPNALRASLPSRLPRDVAELERRIVAPHYPVLQFAEKNLRPSKNQLGFFIREQLGQRRGVADVVGQDISILPDGRPLGEGSITLIDGKVKDLDKPTPQEREFLSWLKKMDDVVGVATRVKSDFLGPLVPDDQERIVSRVRFSTGRLRTSDLSDEKFEFVEIGGEVPAVVEGELLATQLALEFEAEEKVRLVFRSFGSTEPEKLVLGPSDDDPDEDVEIRLENLEPERLLGIDVEPEGRDGLIIDPDFAVYYDLLDGLRDRAPVRVPLFRDNGGPILGVGKPCSPVGVNAERSS